MNYMFNFLFGSLVYFSVVIGAVLSESIKGTFQQVFELAFELSTLMAIIYFYPFVVFIHTLLKKDKNSIFLESQAKLAASSVVSLGLIGTFVGLTGMISSISGALSDPDPSALITSIGGSLSSMSYAFLTSIFGVALSLIIMISANFWLKGLNQFQNNITTKVKLTVTKPIDLYEVIRSNLALTKAIEQSESNECSILDIYEAININNKLLECLIYNTKPILMIESSIKSIEEYTFNMNKTLQKIEHIIVDNELSRKNEKLRIKDTIIKLLNY